MEEKPKELEQEQQDRLGKGTELGCRDTQKDISLEGD